MSKLLRREYDYLLNFFGYDKIEWFYTDLSEQQYNRTYDEYGDGKIKVIRQGLIRGILINDAAKVVAAYGEGNQDNYPFNRLEETVLFKCSASDCAALGILNIDDNFEFEDIQEQGKNTGEIEGVLNYKFIRYRNEWYKAVDIRKGNVFKGEPANVVITAEIVADLLQAVNGNTFSGNTILEIVVPVDKYKVYIDNILYNEYESGANVNLTPETKEGYKFKGYESYDVTITNNSFTMPENDVYINSIYAAIFTVKIDNQILGEYEENEIVEIDAGSKEGFKFKNWSGNITIDSPNSAQTSFNMPNFNVELQTEWEEVINTWTVIISDTMNMDGTYSVTKDDSIILNAGENTPQYDFSRWNIVSGSCEGDLTQTYTTITPTSDMNIQCVWQFNNKWLVSYSGMEKAAEWILAGMTVYINAPDKEGYNFSQWTSNAQITFSAPNSQYSSFTMPAQNVTVTANYEIKTYTVTFYSDGAEYDTVIVNYGATVNRPTDPTKQYYTFNEWQDSQGNSVNFSAQIYENKNYYADFIRDTCIVTFDSDGGTSVESIEILAGNNIGNLPTPSKDNKVFAYWTVNGVEINSSYIVTSNITALAIWEDIPEFDEVALIDLNSSVDMHYYNRIMMYNGNTMTNYTNVTDADHFVLPMYVGKYYTDNYDMTTKAGRSSAYNNFSSVVPEQCYNQWQKPFTEPYPPYADGTENYVSWNYSTAAKTKFITYSKWLFDEFDDDKQDLPRNPPFIEISGSYRYFNFANLYLPPIIDRNSNIILLKVTDIGRGWYRYEWGETGDIPYVRTQTMPSTISHTFTQDPV